MENQFQGQDRREHERFDCMTPLAYKICNQETLSKLFQGYTVNVSESGLLCSIHDNVKLEDVMWLSFNKSVLELCASMDKHSFFYQNGIIGKVVRISDKEDGTHEVGIHFITREEQNFVNTHANTRFIKDNDENKSN